MALRGDIRRGTWALCLAALVAGCNDVGRPAAAAHTSEVRVATIGALSGDARVKRSDSDEWSAAAEGMVLHPDDKLRTRKGASATLVFEAGSTLSIAEDSLVAMPASTLAGVRLEKGNVDVDVPRREPAPGARGDDFVVETPAAKARVPREIVFQ